MSIPQTTHAAVKIMLSFREKLVEAGQAITRKAPKILQLNLGKLCNLTCIHCHVNAGPHRKEMLDDAHLEKTLQWFEASEIPTIDLTGGTPEMHPSFQNLVSKVRSFAQPREIITRLNATIINEPGFEWVADFHSKQKIVVIASMPCYSPENVNAQRGDGVFESSIHAFQKLNALGYGVDPSLPLHLVYNPVGASLPPNQERLEAEYKTEMKKHFGIVFNKLFCITNMPISRYASYLKRQGSYHDYLELLVNSFNSNAIEHLMCRETISVDWEGRVFDCDFNQQLNLQSANGNSPLIWDLNLADWARLPIFTADHCFGCTAGAGSSCQGSLV